MAQKKINLKIIDSNDFLEMPNATQLLYFHLSVKADVDGFISMSKKTKIMEKTNIPEYDLKILTEKKYVIQSENGVYLTENSENNIENKSNISPPSDINNIISPFDWDNYHIGMSNDPKRGIRFIAYYFKVRELNFSTKLEAQTAIKQHLRAANQVINFSRDKIDQAIDRCQQMEVERGIRWTPMTVLKELTK